MIWPIYYHLKTQALLNGNSWHQTPFRSNSSQNRYAQKLQLLPKFQAQPFLHYYTLDTPMILISKIIQPPLLKTPPLLLLFLLGVANTFVWLALGHFHAQYNRLRLKFVSCLRLFLTTRSYYYKSILSKTYFKQIKVISAQFYYALYN